MQATAHEDRRLRRSDDMMTALHYQLALARQKGEFDAMVLADSSGCVVAGAGAWPTCERLAAYAPLLARHVSDAALLSELGKMGDHAVEVEVRTLVIEGNEVLLCTRGGGEARVPAIARAAAGCRRILGGEA